MMGFAETCNRERASAVESLKLEGLVCHTRG